MKSKRKLNSQMIFTIVVGLMMITWAVSLALSYNINTGTQQQTMKIETVYDKPLTAKEKLTILRSGRVIIEFYHNGSQGDLDRKAAYENFAARFNGIVVLEAVEVEKENQTIDRMINPQGEIIPLDNVTSDRLIDFFCDTSIVQPKECLLRDI